MNKEITKEFIKWLEEKDRQNWEIERFVEGLLVDQKQELLEKTITFVEAESGKSGRKEIIEYLKSLK